MIKFDKKIEHIKKQQESNPNFCKDVCNLCYGDKKECVNCLLIEINRLNTKIKNLNHLLSLSKKHKPNKKLKGGYIKVKRLSLQEVLPHIGVNKKLQISENVSVNTSSVRLHTFKDNIVCVSCGLIGTHFWAEKFREDERPHLNLYAVDGYGKEVLMTKDHIIPKSKGGTDSSENMQTMCTHCNCKKGNSLNF